MEESKFAKPSRFPGGRISLGDDGLTLHVTFPYSQELPRLMGALPRAKFDFQKKVWKVLMNRTSGNELWKIFGGSAFSLEARSAIEKIPKLSEAGIKDIVIPVEVEENRIPGIVPGAPKLFDYQKSGIAFMMRNKRAFNADNIGLGKSVQAIAAAVASGCERILVVCYNFLVPNWDREIMMWTGRAATVIRAGKKELLDANVKEIEERAAESKFCIIHYDILERATGVLDMRWDCVIADESHAIKSHKTHRARAMNKIKTEYFFMLTGTPVLNRPIELWSQLDILMPGEFGSYWSFGDRYALGEPIRVPIGVYCRACDLRRKHVKDPCIRCGSQEPAERRYEMKKSYNGATNLGELRKRLDPIMISRKRNDVKKDLPPFTRIDRLVSLSGIHLEKYEALKEDLTTYLMTYEEKTPEEAARSASSDPLVKAGKFRQLLSKAKLSYCADEIRQVLASGNSVLAFTCYLDSTYMLREMIANGTGVNVVAETDKVIGKLTEAVLGFSGGCPENALEILQEISKTHVDPNILGNLGSLGKPPWTALNVEDYVDGYFDKKEFASEISKDGKEEKMHAFVHTGEENLKEKTFAISQFKAIRPSALVCTIQSAGVGLNLTEASYTFFVDLPWTPAELVQAEGRTNRIGQTAELVTYIRYFASGTYDAEIAQKLRDKQAIFDQLVGAADDKGINADERLEDFRKVILREMFAQSRKKRKKGAAKK